MTWQPAAADAWKDEPDDEEYELVAVPEWVPHLCQHPLYLAALDEYIIDRRLVFAPFLWRKKDVDKLDGYLPPLL